MDIVSWRRFCLLMHIVMDMCMWTICNAYYVKIGPRQYVHANMSTILLIHLNTLVYSILQSIFYNSYILISKVELFKSKKSLEGHLESIVHKPHPKKYQT